MTRLPDWDIRLAGFIDRMRDRPFEWGVTDCSIFVNDAIRAQTGTGLFDDITTHRDKVTALRRLTEVGDVISIVDSRLDRCVVFPPPRGSVLARNNDGGVLGWAFGVMATPRHVAFMGVNGIEFHRPRRDDIAWTLP